jgi:hypothetical protein
MVPTLTLEVGRMSELIGSVEPTQPSADGAPKAHAAMQAVVVIHGMGEQRPMDTIKAFVRAVWETDEDITRNGLPNPTQVWSKPDERTGSLELRRITTRETITSPPEFPGGVRTDFYELYWADLTAGSTWNQFTAWVGGLLFRPWNRVPRDVHLACPYAGSHWHHACSHLELYPMARHSKVALAIDGGSRRGDRWDSSSGHDDFRTGGALHSVLS